MWLTIFETLQYIKGAQMMCTIQMKIKVDAYAATMVVIRKKIKSLVDLIEATTLQRVKEAAIYQSSWYRTVLIYDL